MILAMFVSLWSIPTIARSRFTRHLSCEACGSSDANSLYDDGHTHCFSCGVTTFLIVNDKKENSSILTELKKDYKDLTDRKISRASAEKYGIWREGDTTYFPYFNDGKHLANKVRYPDKEFSVEGDIKHSGLFGSQLFPAGSAKFITLVEGEYDAPAAFELMGSRWPVVSVRTGTNGASSDVADNFEYLNSFPNIVICFDKDEAKLNEKTGQIRYPGQEAALAVAGMFPIGKVKVLTLAEAKDPNDYLKSGKREQFNREWWSAPVFTPSGLKFTRDMWEEISTPKNYETVPYPWESLNAQTYGIRLSEFVVFTAETGVGKTSVIKEIEYNIRKASPKTAIGLLHLEETNSDTALGLMSIEANLPLHLPDVRDTVKKEELRDYFDRVLNTDKLIVYDHFGSNSIQEILNKVRHMHNLGCKYIILDHLSIVVSDQSGDERKQLDEISTKLKTLCMELNIAVIAVIHVNRKGEIRGTAGVEQLANIVIKLHREKLSEDPWRRNVVKLIVEKNRFCGRTGPGAYLHYNEFTGRLSELTQEDILRYNTGGGATIEHQW
jgi:twinkle protein